MPPYVPPRLPPITAGNFTGIWVTDSYDVIVRLYVRPRGPGRFAITTIIDSGWAASRYVYDGRATTIGLGDDAVAFLQLESPGLPVSVWRGPVPSGYFVIRYFAPVLPTTYEFGNRDRLDVCPIPAEIMIDAVRSGRLAGEIVMRDGHAHAVLTASAKAVGDFLRRYALAPDSHAFSYDICGSAGFHGIRRPPSHGRPANEYRWPIDTAPVSG